MYQNHFYGGGDWLGLGLLPAFTILPFLVWSLVWKGWAIWLAARRGEMPWFIALLIVNTLGILEIFYIFVIAKQSDVKEVNKSEEKKESTHNHA